MLIGREKEIQELRHAYDSDESKFIAYLLSRTVEPLTHGADLLLSAYASYTQSR